MSVIYYNMYVYIYIYIVYNMFIYIHTYTHILLLGELRRLQEDGEEDHEDGDDGHLL